MTPIRVLLADDHALVRCGMRAVVQGMPGIEVVGEAADGRTALELVARLRPHVVLMDITMPELNGLEAAARLRREWPEVRVVLLSMHANESYVARARALGVSGYVLKSADARELERAIRAAARGRPPARPAAGGTGRRRSRPGAERDPALTPRQREILQLIAEGNATRTIACKLGLSVKTVETHRAHLMERLRIHDVPGLVRYAIRTGLILADG